MAENIVESIIVKLGLDGSQYNREADKAVKQNQTLNKSVGETDKVVGAVTKTVAKWFSALAVATGVAKMIDQVQKLNEELFHLEKNLGMSSQTIKNWQGAAGAMGGSAQGMTESMKGLNKAMNDYVVKGDAGILQFTNALGVSILDTSGKIKDTDKLMLDLADSFSKMDREQAFGIASDMGIDEGTFNTLVQGRKEMEKMLEYQSKMYKSSEEELKASRALAQNRALLGQHWESLKTMMANAIIPLFVKLSEVALGIFEYLQENQQAVQAVFKGISFVVGAILIPILAKATIAALAFIAPFAPFILVVGALGAAFGLLYDDYKAWAEGGKSLFDWGAFATYIDNAKFSTDNLKNSFAYLLTGYKDWASAAEGGKEWLKLKGFIEDGTVSVDSMTAGFKNLASEMLSNVIPTLKGYGSILSKLFSGDFKGAMSEAKEMGLEYWKQATERGNALGDRLRGALDIATGQEVGTASDVSIVSRNDGSFDKRLAAAAKKAGITDKKEVAAFKAIVGHETGDGKKLTEDARYSYKGWKRIAKDQRNVRNWLAKNSEADFNKLSNKDKLDIMYEGMNGNRKGEGYKFRGRGGIQLTGRANYQAFADYIGRPDIMTNPDLVAKDPQLAAESAAWYWKNRKGVSSAARSGDIKKARRLVNGGDIGMTDVLARYKRNLNDQETRPIQSSIRQNDKLAANTATAGRSNPASTNKTDVHIGEVKIQTSSSTMTGTGQDLANGVQDQWSMFQNAVR